MSPTDAPERVTWRFWVLPAVLAVLLLALVATSVILLLDRPAALPEETAVPPAAAGAGGSTAGSTDGSDPARQALAAARLAARTYFTVDHTSVESDMDRFRELATPAFVVEYDEAAEPLAQRVVEQELQLSATLPADGVATEYLSQNVAQLLVSVDVTTRRGRESSTAEYRTRVLLQRVDEQWRVAGMDEVL